jgi:helicase required for RNAi-mediated heterochromatin assembly 1
MNANLAERFKGTRRTETQNTPSDQDDGPDPSLNLNVRAYVADQERIQASRDSEDWLSEPEIPTAEELCNDVTGLLPNKIGKPYKSKERYLKIHYGLLREDAVGSLREAVLDFRQDPSTDDTTKFSVYDQVHITGFTFARRGLAARIKFTARRAGKRIKWESSKRLVSGSIVALLPANTKTVDLRQLVVAVVAARPLSGVLAQPPEIDLYFARPENIQIDPQKEWLMIEAKQGYFEAYRHTLRALQKLSQETFPLSENICHLEGGQEPPEYIKQHPTLDISAAVALPEQKKAYSSVNIIEDWPAPPTNSLDQSQWDALHETLTKRLAIVQGPPGTGKTFVSKTLLEILWANRKGDDPPIIIAAQTNHALDQLLCHTAAFEPNYIRLGGRSTNSEVRQRALYDIRKYDRIKPIPGGLFGKSIASLTKHINQMTKVLEPLCAPGDDLWSTDQVSGPETLRKLGILTAEQAKSLEDGATQWVSASKEVQGPMKLWLDRAILPFEVDYADEAYGFEEVDDDDLEFEQLRENEDSNGFNDEEEIDMLRGPWQELRERSMVTEPSNADLATAAKLLNTTKDMWNIPEYFRGPVYHLIQTRAKAKVADKFREEAKAYHKIAGDILVGKWEQDATYLERAPIIGMTTTGLSSKY